MFILPAFLHWLLKEEKLEYELEGGRYQGGWRELLRNVGKSVNLLV